MKQVKRYLVTAALPYANGPLHIGQLAGSYVSPDIYVRYLRLKKEDVLFICGSDENGAAITMKAKKDGLSPRAIVDKYHEMNKASFERFGMSFDIYDRTSTPLHYETSSKFFKTLYDKGVFIEKTSEQYFDETYQQFLADRYISGTCPVCSNEGAYGDQCEKCGSTLDPNELLNPKSTLSGQTPVLKTTKHWYLPMGKYQQAVEDWVNAQQAVEPWKKHVLGQCKAWFKAELQDRSMTRDLDWGVPVPLEGAEGKVLYVWLDAPIGYISATKALTDDWELYWKDEGTKLVHFLGKDNIVFHCIIFPMLLQLHGDYILPTNIPANQFLNLEGGKMSTSRNLAVWLHEYLDEFPDMQDVLRYVLTVNMPENKDSDFNWMDFKERNNNDLVGILGNLVNRLLVLNEKYFDSTIPEISAEATQAVEAKAGDVYELLSSFPTTLDGFIHGYEFRNAMGLIMDVARAGNKFLTETAPWHLIKTDKEQTAAVLKLGLELISYLAVYLSPFLPFTAEKIKTSLQLSDQDVNEILSATFTMKAGHKTSKSPLLFRKIEDKEMLPQIEKIEKARAAYNASLEAAAANAEPTYEPLKDTIVYDDFSKLDVRVGTIITAEKVKKADKLLKLSVDLGFEQRTIVSGIAQHFESNDLLGKQVLVVVNLAPRKLRGIVSEGMILTAEEKGKLTLVAPTVTVANGSTIA